MQKLPLVIAFRYLFAKKSQNVINIISMISALGIMVGTAAMLIVLSVFNGLHGFVGSLFGSFDPDLKVEAVEGKVFEADSLFIAQLREVEGVRAVSAVLADNALLKSGKRQMPAMILGVDGDYHLATSIDSILVEGRFFDEGSAACIPGQILASQIGVSSTQFAPQVTFYAPKRTGKINMAMPEQSFVQQTVGVSGVFMVQQVEYDESYVLTDISVARDLFCYSDNEVSALAVRVADGFEVDDVRSSLEQRVGDGLTVHDKWQQHESFFKMMQVEKLMAYLILTFIIVIAAFNVIGSLSMLIYEKRESIFILKSMGASRSLVTRVFLFEGWLVSVSGVVIGLVLGIALVLAQEHFGIVGFGDPDAYIISAYPVALEAVDVVIVFATVMTVAVLAACYPVYSIVGKYYSRSN